MKTRITPTIVVGVSGSRASAAALRWAADEARRRDAHLHVVLCWAAEPRAYYAPARDRHGAGGQDYARKLAATVRRMLDGVAPRGLTTQVVDGGAERALVEESAGADLLVLGSTSSGQSGHIVGPVIRACLVRAGCPVVVVGPTGRFAGHPGRRDEPEGYASRWHAAPARRCLHPLQDRADQMLIGGAMATAFLEAQGLPVGTSLLDGDQEAARGFLAKAAAAGVELLLPSDLAVAAGREDVKPVHIAGSDAIPADQMVLDADGDFGHVSTGGGASLEYLEGRELPGLAALEADDPVPVSA